MTDHTLPTPPENRSPYPPPPEPGQWVSDGRGGGYPPYEPPQLARGQSITALVCGITGAVLGLIPIMFVVAWALGVIAVVFGAIAWKQRRRAQVRKPMAIWGTALGALAIVLGVVGVVIVNTAFDDLESDLDSLGATEIPAAEPAEPVPANDDELDDLFATEVR